MSVVDKHVKTPVIVLLVLLSTLALIVWEFFNAFLSYISVMYPFNYLIVMGGIGVMGLLEYKFVENWFEGWNTSNKRARAIHFSNCIAIGLGIAGVIVGAIMYMNYSGMAVDLLFYGLLAGSMVIGAFGIGIAEAIRQNKTPVGLMLSKRGY